MASDHSTLLRKLRKQGFTIEHSGRHLRVRRDNGRFVTLPLTPGGGRRGLLNCVRELKTIGYEP